ncbi:MAG TPA: hypothetical protein VFB06_10085, partial [Streptosporangiaceae bacterium]|nr:hypothetical protein [Streptosporangiaceae bacterium]
MFDTRLRVPDGIDPTAAYVRPPQRFTDVHFAAGQSVDVLVEHHPEDPGTSFTLGAACGWSAVCGCRYTRASPRPSSTWTICPDPKIRRSGGMRQHPAELAEPGSGAGGSARCGLRAAGQVRD